MARKLFVAMLALAAAPGWAAAAEWYTAPDGKPDAQGTKDSPWDVESALGGRQKIAPGDKYRLMDPRDLYGKPVLEGTFTGKPIAVPLKGEFAAFVLMKEP